MTIPTLVMIASGLCWFAWTVALPDNPSNPIIPRFGPWFIDLCRIVFAASTLVVLWGVMNSSAV